jgi:hypothetical protein
MAGGSASSLDDLQRVLATTVQQAAADAARTAQEAPDRLLGLLDQVLDGAGHAVDEAVALTQEQFQRLKDAVAHPDWLGLLTFALVRLVELVGDPRLTVVAVDPGVPWGRAVALRYLAPTPGGDTELRLALALGGDATATHGVIITARNGPDLTLPAGPVLVTATAAGDGEWRIPFGGPLGDPTGLGSVRLDLHLGEHLLQIGRDDGLGLGIGAPGITAQLAAGTGVTPTGWTVTLRFGPAGSVDAGLHATVDLAPLLGVVAEVVHLTALDERYTPRLTFARGTPPSLDLGHVGSA